MKYQNILTILILLTSAAFAPTLLRAQADEQLNAEADRFVSDYVNKNVTDVMEKVINASSRDDASNQANVILRIDPYNSKILETLSIYWANHPEPSYAAWHYVMVFLKYIELNPNDPNGYYSLAYYLTKNGYVAEADKYYVKAAELSPTEVWKHHYMRGEAAFYAGNYGQCVESMKKALTLPVQQGDQRWTYAVLSWCYGLQGDKANAQTNLQKAISIGGDDISQDIRVKSGAYLSNSFKCGKDQYEMWEKYVRRKYKSAEEKYFAYFQLMSCYPNSYPNEGQSLASQNPQLYDWRGVYYVMERKKGAAEYWAKNPIDQQDQKDADSWFNLLLPYARASYLKGEYDKVLDHTVKFLFLDPKRLETYSWRAEVFLEKPEFKILAWREANKILALYPNSALARGFRARVFYELKNNKEKALAEINEGINNNRHEDTANLYFIRGKIYYGEKEYAKAVSDFDTVLKIYPKYLNAEFYRNLALNPQNGGDSAIAAQKKEIEIKQKISEVIKDANASADTYRFLAGKTQIKEEKCKHLKWHLNNMYRYENKLRELDLSVAASSPLKQEILKNLEGIKSNIKNILEGGQSCGNL